MGSIISGKYYKDGRKEEITLSSTYEEDRREGQRQRFRKDLIQPRKYGQLNKEFFQAFPDKAQDYDLSKDDLRRLGL